MKLEFLDQFENQFLNDITFQSSDWSENCDVSDKFHDGIVM